MTDDTVSMVLDDARERMAKVVTRTRADFGNVRTGRAAPALVEKLAVEYYGSNVPLQQLAGFSVPEARMLVVTPYDKAAIGATWASIPATTASTSASRSRRSPRSAARSS